MMPKTTTAIRYDFRFAGTLDSNQCWPPIHSLCSTEESAILQLHPTPLVGRRDLVVRQEVPQRHRRALIEKDAHLRGCERAARGVLEHRTNLLDRHAGEPLGELVDGRAVLEILEQRGEGNARAAEQPGAADAIRVAFGGFA